MIEVPLDYGNASSGPEFPRLGAGVVVGLKSESGDGDPYRRALLMEANTIRNWKYPTISVTQRQP